MLNLNQVQEQIKSATPTRSPAFVVAPSAFVVAGDLDAGPDLAPADQAYLDLLQRDHTAHQQAAQRLAEITGAEALYQEIVNRFKGGPIFTTLQANHYGFETLATFGDVAFRLTRKTWRRTYWLEAFGPDHGQMRDLELAQQRQQPRAINDPISYEAMFTKRQFMAFVAEVVGVKAEAEAKAKAEAEVEARRARFATDPAPGDGGRLASDYDALTPTPAYQQMLDREKVRREKAKAVQSPISNLQSPDSFPRTWGESIEELLGYDVAQRREEREARGRRLIRKPTAEEAQRALDVALSPGGGSPLNRPRWQFGSR